MDTPKYDSRGKKVKLTYFQTRTDKFLRVLAGISNVLSGACVPAFVFLFLELVDSLTGDSSRLTWRGWMMLMVYVCILAGVFTCIATIIIERCAEREAYRLRANFIHEVMRQDIGYFDGFDATALATQLIANARIVRELIGFKSSAAFMSFGLVCGCLGLAFQQNWKITIVSICTLPVVVVAGWWSGREQRRAAGILRSANEILQSTALEGFGAMRTVKAFSLEDAMSQKFSDELGTAHAATTRANWATGVGTGTYWCLIFLSCAFGFWYGGYFLRKDIVSGRCTDEDCLSISTLLGCFILVVLSAYFIGKLLPWFTESAAALRAVRNTVALYSRVSKIDCFNDSGLTEEQLFGSAPPTGGGSEIVLDNIVFTYPNRGESYPVFSNLCLTIPPATSIALVGASGSGKSTIVQLLLRFYDPDEGVIRIDGYPITDINVRTLRQIIGWVPQEPRLFATTIAENIAVGLTGGDIPGEDEGLDEASVAAKRAETFEKVVEAAKQAQAHDFITALPEGYDTWVGEAGGQMSGGQKQRIAIARALIKHPRILILDEATSALDNKSEKMVQETIDKIVSESGCTTIIIAHRLSTIKNAGVIAVLQPNPGVGSKVVEMGTHEELLQINDGVYRSLVNVQLTGADDSEADEERQEDEEFFSYEQNLERQRVTGSRELNPNMSIEIRKRQSKSIESMMSMTEVFPMMRKGSAAELGGEFAPQQLYRRSADMARAAIVWYVCGVIGNTLYFCTWPVFGIMFAQFIKAYLHVEDPDRILRDSTIGAIEMICIGLVAFVSFLAMTICIGRTSLTIVSKMRQLCHERLMRQEMGFYDQPHRSPAQLVYILCVECLLLGDWVAANSSLWISSALSLLFSFIFGFKAGFTFGLVCVASVAILIPVSYAASSFMSSGASFPGFKDRTAEINEKMGNHIMTVIMNIRSVTAYNMQKSIEKEFKKYTEALFKEGYKKAWIAGIASGLIVSLRFGSFTLIFYYGAKQVEASQIAYADMIQGAVCVMLAGLQIGRTLAGSVAHSLGREAAKDAWLVIDRVPAIVEHDPSQGQALNAIERVEFRNVAFAYPTRPNTLVYKAVSFKLESGQSVALVGASGCGKSTAVQLLERFYDALHRSRLGTEDTEGVFVNSKRIEEWNTQSIRRRIGLIGQEPVLFSGSVIDNIRKGRADASEDEVIDVCKKANAWEFVEKLPEGIHTEVGRGGSLLSGGQKQRIAIARALIRMPDVLLLDEATSALDAESEKVVQDSINNLLQHRQFNLALVIAHRLSTVRVCDVIVVFVPGSSGSRVVEIGSHASLMNIPNGVYRSLVNCDASQPAA